MQKKFYPSMMCADFTQLRKEVSDLEEAHVDGFHIDIMDGHFVPNMALGVEDYQAIRSLTTLPMDAHLMVQDPQRFIKLFADLGANTLYVHPEADQIPTKTLQQIKDLGLTPGLAINPGTSVASIEPLLNLAAIVLVMTVNPGFSGQKYLDFVDTKIAELVSLKPRYDYQIVVDGAISANKVSTLSQMGVDGFVLGTSSLFGQPQDYKSIIKSLR